MVVETIYSRKDYRLNREDIVKFKEMFGIKGIISKINIIDEEWLDISCKEN